MKSDLPRGKLTPMEEQRLRAVMDRIIPRDEYCGSACDLQADQFVIAILNGDASPYREAIERGLASLDQTFHTMDGESQDRALQSIEHEPWFAALVDLTAEGYYADPGNGGNKDAGSWAMVGYRHGMPEGPSGPAGFLGSEGTR